MLDGAILLDSTEGPSELAYQLIDEFVEGMIDKKRKPNFSSEDSIYSFDDPMKEVAHLYNRYFYWDWTMPRRKPRSRKGTGYVKVPDGFRKVKWA
jgi:hypothetical protein